MVQSMDYGVITSEADGISAVQAGKTRPDGPGFAPAPAEAGGGGLHDSGGQEVDTGAQMKASGDGW